MSNIQFRDTFAPTGSDHMKYEGMKFVVVRELEPGTEYDKVSEDHRMYLIRLEDGTEVHAFEDEVER